MIPVVFDGCRGLLHDAPGDVAIVMCGAPGFEQLCAHRGWRTLANMLSARGYPTLRFDLDGCGDSLGDDFGPDRVAAWRRSLASAADFARKTLRPRKIIIVGLRFGATLAAELGARLRDIDGLVTIGGAISGRLYGREVAGLASVMAPATPDEAPGGLSVAGFFVANETLDAMKALDLRKLPTRPAASALIVAPEGQMGAEETRDHWRSLGCDANLARFDGYAQWLAEPTFSRTPLAMFDEVVAWTLARFPATPRANAAPGRIMGARLDGPELVETPIQFGPAEALYGVFCAPRAPNPDGVATILLNAGANSHIGWARMNVEGARRLAGAGFASLRIDVAGLGDSAPAAGRAEQVMYDLAPRADVSAAIDELAGLGYKRFVLIGLCSGAHTAFHTALADARVNAIVMVNLQKFIWRDGDSLAVMVRQAYRSTDSYKRGALRVETYRRLIRGEIDVRGIARELGRRAGRAAFARGQAVLRLVREGDDETSRVRRWFRELSARGARAMVVYAADDGGRDELSLHMGPDGRRLRAMSGMSVEILDGADHNLTQRRARNRLFDLIEPMLRDLSDPGQARDVLAQAAE